jgi:ligand-binding SRPBCC domain-containing protein
MMNTELEFSTTLNATAKEVFEFHLNFENATRITPSVINVRIVKSPAILTEGSNINVEMCQFGFCFPWDVQIIKIVPHSLMIDIQSGRGPFFYWKHEHHFLQKNGRCTMTDKIEYSMPFGIIGRIIDRIAIRFLQKRIFAYRHSKMKLIFP